MKNHVKIIANFMAEHRISQVEMAERLQVTPATLSRWLSGSHGISKKHQQAIEFICADSILPDVTKKLFERIRKMPEARQWLLYEELIRNYTEE